MTHQLCCNYEARSTSKDLDPPHHQCSDLEGSLFISLEPQIYRLVNPRSLQLDQAWTLFTSDELENQNGQIKHRSPSSVLFRPERLELRYWLLKMDQKWELQNVDYVSKPLPKLLISLLVHSCLASMISLTSNISCWSPTMSGAAFLEAIFHHLTSHHEIRLACDTNELYRIIRPAASTRKLTVSICAVACFSSRSTRFPETREHGVQGWYRGCDDLPNRVSFGIL